MTSHEISEKNPPSSPQSSASPASGAAAPSPPEQPGGVGRAAKNTQAAQPPVWFVTGASKGLGLVLVQKLLAAGHRVAATSRSLVELTAKLGPATASFLPLQLDLGDEPAAAAAAAAARSRFGRLDVVVNNAGYGQFGAVEEVSDAEARRNFDVNIFGVLNVLRATLPYLRAQRSGHVFNISSIGGYTGAFSGWGIYCATKFALAGLTESLHADLQPHGVHVTLVYPGYFRTEFLASSSMAMPARPLDVYQTARASAALHTGEINGHQPGDPAKLADALLHAQQLAAPPLHLFLGSDAVGMAERKQAEVRRDLDAHRAISVATDY
jgi:NAD(P)-dependent dehydrogenase (short-subunit alcohol dehydrogenase family)